MRFTDDPKAMLHTPEPHATRIPLNDLQRQTQALRIELSESLDRVLDSGRFVMADEVSSFEREFANYLELPSAIAVANGTDALEIALRAVGCEPGDEVITVANAGMYATTAAMQVGCVPVFAEIEPHNLQISSDSVAKLIGPRTKVIVVTHLFGAMADIEAICELTQLRGLAVIEDCSQAHGAANSHAKAGGFGDIGTFSFYPSKNLGAIGDAGALVCRDESIARRIRELSQYGWSDRFHSQIPYGRNSRLDELQAAILRTKLSYLDQWNACRRDIVEQYAQAASNQWTLPYTCNSSFVAHLCVAQHDDRATAIDKLASAGIDTAIHYPVPDHRQRSLHGQLWRADELDVTEHAQERILSLPCFPELTAAEVARVCDHLL